MSKRKAEVATAPRKEPKQQRSRQTYQMILDGAVGIIRRDGMSKLSTNRVAEETGVSIGSLYQYFPSKAAIVAALIDQMLEQEFIKLKSALEEGNIRGSARETARSFLGQYYRLNTEDLSVRRSMMAAVASLDKATTAQNFHNDVAAMVVEYFKTHFEVAEQDWKAATFILQYTLKGIALSSVDEQIQTFCRETLAGELTEMMLNLLRVSEVSRQPSAKTSQP